MIWVEYQLTSPSFLAAAIRAASAAHAAPAAKDAVSAQAMVGIRRAMMSPFQLILEVVPRGRQNGLRWPVFCSFSPSGGLSSARDTLDATRQTGFQAAGA